MMKSYIALLRGINVGGKNRLPMKALIPLLETLKLENVRSYIQSGNVVFKAEKINAPDLSSAISTLIEKNIGFKPELFIYDSKQFKKIVHNNPYHQLEKKHLHYFFLAGTPRDVDLDQLQHLAVSGESFELTKKVFYLYAPNGIGRSKLAGKIEKLLGVSLTARNGRTVEELMILSGRSGR